MTRRPAFEGTAVTEYLIIGADAAGLSAALQIKRKRSRAEVKVLAKGRIISYGACGIPYVLSGEIASPSRLIHFTPEKFLDRAGIPVLTGQEAVGLLPETHEVEVKDLDTGRRRREGYDQLLIAAGAVAHRLPFLDYGLEGLFSLHTIEDLERTLDFIDRSRPRRAAVIGAGNVGLEVVEALRRRGLSVVLIEILDSPAPLWPRLIRRAVREKLAEKQVDFRPETEVEAVEKRDSGLAVSSAGFVLESDIVFVQVGTRPATDWCRNNLAAMPNGALLIDETCRTSDRNIFAAGDCAAVRHRVLGTPVYSPLGSTANKLGRLAGINMAGGALEFPGIAGTQIFRFFDLSLARTGIGAEEAIRAGFAAESVTARSKDRSTYFPGATEAEAELVFDSESGRVLGAAVVSRGNAGQLIDPAAVAVTAGLTVKDLAWFDSAYSPPFAPVWNALVQAAFRAAKF